MKLAQKIIQWPIKAFIYLMAFTFALIAFSIAFKAIALLLDKYYPI